MRQCSRCGTTKPDGHFAWRRKDKGWRETYCRPCRAEYKQRHYAKNKQRYIDQAAAWNRRVLEERVTYLISYLRAHPCVDCGEGDPVVLEFDHVNDDKKFDIAYGIRNHNWDLVLKEIEKCEVVCVNCHRRRTASRAGFYRALAFPGKAGRQVI